MLEFQLFRIKVFPTQQGSLFEAEKSRPEILREAISSHPEAEFREGMTWHIGNVTEIDDSGMYFRIGRTSKSTIEVYDDKEGNFQDEEFELAPYTHALVDVELEVCAIAKKSRLAPKASGIASQLVRLLNESRTARLRKASFEADELKDPEDFISHLRAAYSISKFWITLSRPNAFDANEDFVKPVQAAIEQSDGESGKVEVKGVALKSDTLESITRSVAATGDDAGALLQPSPGVKKTKKQLKGSSVNITQEDVADNGQKVSLLGSIREVYRRIRGNQETDGDKDRI